MMGNNNAMYKANNNHSNNNHALLIPKRGEIPPGLLLPSHHSPSIAISYAALKTIQKKKKIEEETKTVSVTPCSESL